MNDFNRMNRRKLERVRVPIGIDTIYNMRIARD